MKQSNTQTLIDCTKILADDIISPDGIPNAALREVAQRLESYYVTLQQIRETGDAGLAAIALDPGPEGRGEEPLPW